MESKSGTPKVKHGCLCGTEHEHRCSDIDDEAAREWQRKGARLKVGNEMLQAKLRQQNK